jgi:serine phosphatase RsbU (regulator of sigma subunit)
VRAMTMRVHSSADVSNGVDPSVPDAASQARRAVDAAGMSMAFDAHSPAGGDWWDLVVAPNGDLVAVFGDALGHGDAAAGQARWLSTLARSLIEHGHDDGATMQHLDAALRADPAAVAGVVMARLRPAAGELRVVQAGHLPAMLVTAGGQVSTVPALVAPPLGAGLTAGQAPTVRLGKGDTVVFVSDGVIQRRHQSFEKGLAALEDRLGRHRDRPLHQLCAAVLCSLEAALEDDATVLALRWRGCKR